MLCLSLNNKGLLTPVLKYTVNYDDDLLYEWLAFENAMIAIGTIIITMLRQMLCQSKFRCSLTASLM